MKRCKGLWSGLTITGLVLMGFAALSAPDGDAKPNITPQQAAFFESKIRPLLFSNCFSCHSDKQQSGGLRLDSRDFLLKGNANGPALVPGDPDKSRLIQVVRYDGKIKMPPAAKLKPEEIAALVEWVKMGAPWPEAKAVQPMSAEKVITPEQRNFWSFRPVQKAALPKVKNLAWCKSPIDRFILAKLEAKGLQPAPPADKRTLLRRAYFDLIGLPPTPAEVDAFLADTSPNAFAKVVDHLLASPHYGERWGRHWLDVARYSDSNGLDENLAFGNAYRYRDYVIAAFNKDKPYNQFIMEQLAGDLMPTNDETLRNERLTATGFLSLGPKVLAEQDKPKMVMDIVDEQIEVTSKAFLGLTVACARCHDHKFDPIPTKDYYALAGIFKSTRTMQDLGFVSRIYERPLMTRELQQKIDASDKRIAPLKAALQAETDRANKEVLAAFGKAFPGPHGASAHLDKPERFYSEASKSAIKKAQEALKTAEAQAPKVPMTLAVEDGRKVEDCRVHIRGNTLTLGDVAPRCFLRVIAGDHQTPMDTKRSGRLELAQWLTQPDHPLTARVVVNRIWEHHFGEGIVRTPDNFGLMGDRPDHPELLDWLAATFVEKGWSMKAMHRLILFSSAYQMSSDYNAQADRLDPENRLLWRMSRRRLEAEPFRDAILAVAGTLDTTMGGSLLTTGDNDYVTNDQSANAARYNSPRRSVYLPIIRNALFDMFLAFDYGDPSMTHSYRPTTTVAPQALWVMNSPFALEQARHFAEALLADPKIHDSERIRQAYLKAFSRPSTPTETQHALGYVALYESRLAGTEPDARLRRIKAWQSLCQILFASNEFLYVN